MSKPKKKHAVDAHHGKLTLCQPVRAPITVPAALKHMTTLNSRIAKIRGDSKSSSGWTFVSKDTKDDPAVVLAGELKDFTEFARSSLRGMLGMKAIPLVLPVTQDISTDASGVVTVAFAVAVTQSPEWASVAALFDEYRFVKGRTDFTVIAPTNTVVLGTSTLTNNANFAIGYDPADQTAPTNVRDIVQLEQHLQLFPRMSATQTVGTYVGLFGKQDNTPYSLHYDVKDTALVTTAVTGVGTGSAGMWKATSISPLGDGNIKAYYTSGFSTALVAVIGTSYYHVLVRSRT
jgi:hypothetical protein